MAGVGAARDAVGARSISTSSASKLSSLLSAGRSDDDGELLLAALGVRVADSSRECLLASGDAFDGLVWIELRKGVDALPLPLLSPDRPKPNAALNPD